MSPLLPFTVKIGPLYFPLAGLFMLAIFAFGIDKLYMGDDKFALYSVAVTVFIGYVIYKGMPVRLIVSEMDLTEQ